MFRREIIGPKPDSKKVEQSDVLADKRLEALKEKREPSLGETNPLLHGANFLNPEAVEALTLISQRNIDEHDGIKPISMRTALIEDAAGEMQARLVVRFELSSLSEHQIELLEEVVKEVYQGIAVRTRLSSAGRSVNMVSYQHFEQQKKSGRTQKGGSLLGWHMGPDVGYVDATTSGLYVFRDIGNAHLAPYFRNLNPEKWFTQGEISDPMSREPLKSGYVVEIRAEGMYQTDIVKFITLASIALAGKELPDKGRLLYKIYNDLNRLGLRKAQRENIAGLDGAITNIERELILPLANYDASDSILLRPSSVLLVGVPGTGKTLLAEYFLQQDNGVFFVPLEVLDLMRELSAPLDKQKILPRLAQVFAQTGIPLIVHIDDIEKMTSEEDTNKSKLLNLMAGVRERGFYVLASTNYPEKINPQLLQPERFGSVEYFGLQGLEARKSTLRIHAVPTSRELRMPLFSSDGERELIVSALGNITDGYTARFLADICTQAKSCYLQRITREKDQRIGLKEIDLDIPFIRDDWDMAFEIVNRIYNKAEIAKWDQRLREFVRVQKSQMGFIETQKGHESVTLFTQALNRLGNAGSTEKKE